MVLNFSLIQQIKNHTGQRNPDDTIAFLNVDTKGRASLASLAATPPKGDHVLFRYRQTAHAVRFGTNAFFFQEGHGEFYEDARYGGFRVDADGNALLEDLYDSQLQPIALPMK